jgi:hypothetical protein
MWKPFAVFLCGTTLASAAAVAILPTFAWCAGPDWVLLDQNPGSRFYYDQSDAKKPGTGIVQVRTRVIYTDEGKADALKILEDAQKFALLSESRCVYDLDCKKEQSRLLEVRHIDEEGVTLKTTDLKSATEWEEISPDGRLGLVQEKVCLPTPAQK